MAHAAKLYSLTESLISSLTGLPLQDERFKDAKAAAYRALRNQSYARTNQFEIRAKYEGLIEKFSVLNRDDLAESLQSRWEELPEIPAQWQPEILSLLLLLSDRPVEKTNVESLNNSRNEGKPTPSLTWDDIVADDPLTDVEIWEDIDRGYHSSGEEGRSDSDELESEPTISTQATSLEDDLEALARLHVVQIDATDCSKVDESHQHFEKASASNDMTKISQLFVIREVILMLQGSPCRLFHASRQGARIDVIRNFDLTTSVSSTFLDQLRQCAEIGSHISILREWCRGGFTTNASEHEQSYMHIQAYQFGILEALNCFDANLVAIEQRFIKPTVDVVVSLLQVSEEVRVLAGPLTQLSHRVVRPSITLEDQPPFAVLDRSYDVVCEAQMSGDLELFHFGAKLLTSATAYYLRPASLWVRHGKVEDIDNSFFIREAKPDKWSLGRLWTDRFQLKIDESSGQAHAPSFMHSVLQQLFVLGKSKAFLRELNQRASGCGIESEPVEGSADFVIWKQFREQLIDAPLTPFPELFEQSLRYWLAENTSGMSDELRRRLAREESIIGFPAMLGDVFHSANGTEFKSFANAIYDRLDRHEAKWDDSFLLTELAQQTLGSSMGTYALNISISTHYKARGPAVTAIQALQSVTIGFAMSWPLQNITHEATSKVDAHAFTLLLQVYYAQRLLQGVQRSFRRKNSRQQAVRILSGVTKLRHDLLWFVDLLFAYVGSTTQLLRLNLSKELTSADSIDAMADSFSAYQQRLELHLMLRDNLKPLKLATTGILELAAPAVTALDHIENQKNLIADLQAAFENNISILTAGLRGVFLTEKSSALEMFADRLGWRPSPR